MVSCPAHREISLVEFSTPRGCKNELFSNKVFLATKEAKFMFQMLFGFIADINPIGAVLESLLPRVNRVQDGH